MTKQTRALLTMSLAVLVTCSWAQSSGKKVVKSSDDLPRFTYPVKGSASALVEADDATFNAFAAKVRRDIDSIFRDYEISDKATIRDLLNARLELQMLAGEYQAALQTVDRLQSEQEKPSSKLTTGIYERAWLQAAIESKRTSGPAFDRAFGRHASSAIDPLPWDVVQDDVRALYGYARIYTAAFAVADAKNYLDSSVEKSGVLDNRQAWELLFDRYGVRILVPIGPPLASALKKYLAVHTVVKPDIWEAREVTLAAGDKATPVLVAIWDSGVDVSAFPGQVFTDPHPTASGVHGLAFDEQGNPAKGWLYELSPEQESAYPGYRDEVKGILDLQDGVDSPEADATLRKFSTLTADQLHKLYESESFVGHYIHGTHCAGIAIRGNAAARLVVTLFHDELADNPFPPSDEWIQRMAGDFAQISEYYKTRHVRVVNMSWGDDVPEFEEWLSRQGVADPVERKSRAEALYTMWRNALESAIKNAPDTLFVTSAGNSNKDTEFGGQVPAVLHLPNLITVGAVNRSGDETNFTSYGDVVVVDADGYNVESAVPGGTKMKLSGTSMASPQVVNLAAKLFALDPDLTPPEVIDLIRRGASTSEDGRRHLIDEKRSVALLNERVKR